MTVKRYDFYYNDDFGAEYSAFQNESDDGEYVSHEDYAALLKESDALAAENAALKKCCDAYDADGIAQYGDQWEVTPIEIPATDAAIANIQAKHLEKFGDELLSDLRGDCWDERDIKYIEMQLNCHLGELRKESGK